MTVRTNELTSVAARPLFFRSSGRAVYQLALMAGAVLFLVAAICQPSISAPINYGDFMGTTVTYTQVTEDANSPGDAPPLFGMPSVSGDSLDFNPVGFDANSSGGGAPDVTDGQLKFGIDAKPGNGIPVIHLTEAGDTTIAGFGDNSTFTSATASGVLDIHEVDFVPINNISVPFSLTFAPMGGFYGLGNVGGGPFFHTQWAGGATLNVAAILAANGIPIFNGATKVSINLDNTLVAATQASTTALIAKKDFGGLSITVDDGSGEGFVPEPSTFVLAGLGLLGAMLGRKRD